MIDFLSLCGTENGFTCQGVCITISPAALIEITESLVSGAAQGVMHIKQNLFLCILFYLKKKNSNLIKQTKQNFFNGLRRIKTDTCQKIYFFLFGSKHISIMRDDLVDAPQWAPS